MSRRRVFVEVSGGVVNNVDVPDKTDGTYTVIDWDDIEADAARSWKRFDAEARAYIRENHPEDFEKWFAPIERYHMLGGKGGVQ